MVRADVVRLSPRMGRSRALSRPWSDSIALFAYCSVTCRAAGTSSSSTPRVDRRVVGDDLDRQRLDPQRAGEEPSCGSGVSAGRDQHVDYLAILIDRAVEVGPAASDLDL